MKAAFVIFAMLICCICSAFALPQLQQKQQPQVSFLKYSNDQDFEEIQRQIIAQYNNLGGSSQFHQIQTASYYDPQAIKISV